MRAELAVALDQTHIRRGQSEALATAWARRFASLVARIRKGAAWQSADELYAEALADVLRDGPRLPGATVQRLALVGHRLRPWPDAAVALQRLAQRFTVVALSNGNLSMLTGLFASAGLTWHCVLSGEMVHAYKPDPAVYRFALHRLALDPRRTLMVAAHPWDLRAAAAHRLRTAYITVAGGGVAQPMRTHRAKPGTAGGTSDDGRHRATAQAGMGRPHPHEYLSNRGRAGPAAAQVGGNRLADIDRQRQLVHPVTLSVNRDLPSPPVQVLQVQRRHLAGPEPEPQYHDDHRIVTPAAGATPIASPQQGLGLGRRDALRQQRPPPPRYRQGRRRQVAIDEADEVAVAQKRTQRAPVAPHRGGRPAGHPPQHRLRHLSRRQLAEVASPRSTRNLRISAT